MCGIFGVISARPVGERDWLQAAGQAIAHRGPDGEGTWWDATGRVGFGHRRLAIVDLSPLGAQPMQIDDGALTVVLNGEIYNHAALRVELEALGHRFRSHSDTEVLLAAYREWGEGALRRLNGMFAFALYDGARERVLLARDRAGEKPLFLYSNKDGELLFGSELKALLCHPQMSRRVAPEAMHAFLGFGYVPQDGCILQGARKLPAGAALIYDLKDGTERQWRYWDIEALPEPDAAQDADPDRLAETLETLLSDAVARQLQADVPVGVLLSGGVDSSLVTALATRHRPKVKTFTVKFPGGGRYDESVYARQIATYFSTDHTELSAEKVEPDLIDMIAGQIDEPMIDSSAMPTYLVSRMTREHCTVAIGGDGADELFGGYRHYSRILWAAKRFGSVPLALRKQVARCANVLLPTGIKGRNHLAGLSTDYQSGVPLLAQYFTDEEIARLMGGPLNSTPILKRFRDLIQPANNLLDRATRTDFRLFMAEDILVKVDRMSMAASLETRAPFLDREVIEFAFTQVPAAAKASSAARKIVLRSLARRLLPPDYDSSRKQGFSVPMARWLQPGEALRIRFEEVLYDPACLFDRTAVKDLFSGLDRGRNNGERLYGLVVFELWRDRYGILLG